MSERWRIEPPTEADDSWEVRTPADKWGCYEAYYLDYEVDAIQLARHLNERDAYEQMLMAGAFEEGRLRGALEEVRDNADGCDLCSECSFTYLHADEFLSAPTLEEGER